VLFGLTLSDSSTTRFKTGNTSGGLWRNGPMHPFAHRPLLCVRDAYVFASNCQTLLGKQSDVQSDAWPECAKD